LLLGKSSFLKNTSFSGIVAKTEIFYAYRRKGNKTLSKLAPVGGNYPLT
jgi:hypothetical protein